MFRIEFLNLDGRGRRRTRVYDVPVQSSDDYWESVTDIPCPCCTSGTIRWAEGGYVPGYRICDKCGRHFLAQGDRKQPTLCRMGTRRSQTS